MAGDLLQPHHAVTHAHVVALARQHAFVDLRIDGGIAGHDPHRAFAERLECRHGQPRQRRAAIFFGPQVARDHDHVVHAGASEAGGVAHAAIGMAMHQRADPRILPQVKHQAEDRMVEQVFAHRTVGHGLDTEPAQRGMRADAGALQDRRRMDGAGREDHLASRPHGPPLTADPHRNAGDMRAIALELQRIDQRLAHDRQVGPMPRRFEIAVVGRDAQARAAVDGIGRGAGALGRVVILAPAVAQADRSLHQGPVGGPPILDRRAIDGNGPVLAVIGPVAKVHIAFELAEVGEDLVPAPAARALGFPVGEILGDAADGDLPVDGRAAADCPAAPQGLGVPAARCAAPAAWASGICRRRWRAADWGCADVPASRRCGSRTRLPAAALASPDPR